MEKVGEVQQVLQMSKSVALDTVMTEFLGFSFSALAASCSLISTQSRVADSTSYWGGRPCAFREGFMNIPAFAQNCWVCCTIRTLAVRNADALKRTLLSGGTPSTT
eukprot:5387001-Amphidinium_carterae.1